jgi:hypothetical protein
MVEPYPIESAIQMLLLDSFLPETKLTVYDLPDEIILSMSAMFLGVPVLEKDYADRKNLEALVKSLKNDTAILTATSAKEMCLAFLHEGEVFGTFHVDEQKFSDKGAIFDEVMNKEPDSTVEISILPSEMTTDKVLFGYGLSTTLEVMKGQAPVEM